MSTLNLPAVCMNPALIKNSIQKEQVNHLSLYFSCDVCCFTPDIGIIKLGILNLHHKKAWMYWHESRTTKDITKPINQLCDIKVTTPEIKYGLVLVDHFQYLWNIIEHSPGVPIDLYDDNISGSFLHYVLSLSITKENARLYQLMMILAIVLHFLKKKKKKNFGSFSWEPMSNVCLLLVV